LYSGATLVTSPADDITTVRIGVGRDSVASRLREVWRSRELLLFLAWRDVSVRYKQTALGVGWAIFQPVLAAAVMTLVFGVLAHVPSESVPYLVFAFCGLLPWQLFSSAFSGAANSLVSNEHIVTKVYFPRLVLPLAAALAALVDFVFALPVFFVLLAWYRVVPTPAICLLPIFVLLALMSALAMGVGLAAVNVRYRDVRHVLPFLTQIWMLATPIVYPASLIPSRWRAWLGINPVAGVVEGFRWSVIGRGAFPLPLLAISTTVATLLLVISVTYFVRAERAFADIA
jgi:lipopolysaccharide transport system permease protein